VQDAVTALYQAARAAALKDLTEQAKTEVQASRAMLIDAGREADGLRSEIDALRAALAQAQEQNQQQQQATAAATAAAAAAMAAIEKMGYGAPRADRPVLHVPKKA